MTRPHKTRMVCRLPNNTQFGPLNQNQQRNEVIIMTVDEYETIRLIDHEGFTQKECSEQMQISRTTVQSIYSSARIKLADLLINNKKLIIKGGRYQLSNHLNKRCGLGCGYGKGRNKKHNF